MNNEGGESEQNARGREVVWQRQEGRVNAQESDAELVLPFLNLACVRNSSVCPKSLLQVPVTGVNLNLKKRRRYKRASLKLSLSFRLCFGIFPHPFARSSNSV